MSKNYFITGGAGFIGSNYVERLLERGEKVTVYDNLSRAGAPRNLKWLQEKFGEKAFELVIGDVRDAAQLGLNKALIVLGHNRSEEVGMKHLPEWLAPLLPGIPVQFSEAGEPFTYV